MKRIDFVEQFRAIYYEDEIKIRDVKKISPEKAILEAEFPDGVFYFVVSENSISRSYDTFEIAEKHAQSKK